MPPEPENPLRPRTQDAPSFVVTTSATPTETLHEPSLPPIRFRRPADALDRAAQIHQTQRPRQAADRRVGPAILAALMLLGAVLLSHALILRDINQMLIHQREVAPRLAR